jgi:hypothetical protein
MLEDAISPAQPANRGPDQQCHMVGQFVAKGSSFALRDPAGAEVWLEMDRIPLHLLGEDVEIRGQRYGVSLVSVEAIGPVRSLS